MATFSVNVNGTSVEFSMSDDDAGRILEAFTKPGQTSAEAIETIANVCVRGLANQAVIKERAQAADAARAAGNNPSQIRDAALKVPEITVTKVA